MPERLDVFMARANAAYYANLVSFQDFTTAPELTQVFGEILGGWARIIRQMLGDPQHLILAEAGPGRGTLMADALRVFGPADTHFIETSPGLRAEQARRVPDATWHDSLDTLPAGPMILLANEFLDALPIRQFVRRPSGWQEFFVENANWIEQPAEIDLPDDPAGTIREMCEAAQGFVVKLARRGAVALFLDYGPLASGPGASLQAIANGAPADPLVDPGTADLTAHVDFSGLAATALAAGATVHGPIKQNAFLTALGMHQRTDRLAQKFPAQTAYLKAAAHRLTAPEAMGSLFKAFAISPSGLPALPGFEA